MAVATQKILRTAGLTRPGRGVPTRDSTASVNNTRGAVTSAMLATSSLSDCAGTVGRCREAVVSALAAAITTVGGMRDSSVNVSTRGRAAAADSCGDR